MGGKYRGSKGVHFLALCGLRSDNANILFDTKGKRSGKEELHHWLYFAHKSVAVSAQDGIKAHLSMADEARNTERHFLRRSGLRLRDNGIKFVSAGDMKPDDPAMLNEFNGLDIHENTAEDTEPHEAEGAAAVHGVHQDAPTTSAEIVDSVERVSTNGKGENQLTENRSPEPLFFYDVEGDPVLLRVERPNPVVRCDTPVLTDSSDDEVIFKGRGALKPAIVIEDPMSECPNSPRVKEAEMPRCESPDNQNTYAPVSGVLDFEKAEGTFSPVSSKAFISLEATTRISKRASKRRRFPREQEDDDGVLADYIENIMNQPSSSEDGAVSDVPGNQSSTVIHTTSAGLDAPVVPDQDPFLSGIFIDRTLLSGTGLAPSPNEPGDIEMDELDEPDLKENSSVGDELDREIDPQPRKYKPGTGVTVFAENLDFSDILDADDDGMDYSTVTRKSRHRNRGSTRRTNFPSASAFADALDEDPYGAFDIMDFDRPSLRKKPKGKRNIPEFGLSDSEMEWQLQMTWENDRKKKKIKKQQREELRAQGLLGKAKKSGTNSGGMKAEDIVSHVRTFLLSDNERYVM